MALFRKYDINAEMRRRAAAPCHPRDCECHGGCGCEPRRVWYSRCTSRAPTVAHVSLVARNGSSLKRKIWWCHLEYLGATRFRSIRDGTSSLVDALIETSKEMQHLGEWSLSVAHLRLARDVQKEGFAISHSGSHLGSSKDHTPLLDELESSGGWRRFDSSPPTATSNIEHAVFYATNTVNQTDV